MDHSIMGVLRMVFHMDWAFNAMIMEINIKAHLSRD